MAAFICIVAALCGVVSAAPPAGRFFQAQQPQQQANPLDYFLDHSDVSHYYAQPQQKQGNANGAPARLETLDPDSEVELVPGVQQPQAPPQQNPVSPNLPGLAPGQRVFIVHMPVPGYRPGTIGGYQPVYIVAASPQGNPGAYPGNGYQQNAILVDPASQGVPFNGFYRPVVPQQNPGIFLGGSLALQRPYDLYQEPNLVYQQPAPQADPRGAAVQFSPQVQDSPSHTNANADQNLNQATPANSKRVGQASEIKDEKEDPRRNMRPVTPHPVRPSS